MKKLLLFLLTIFLLPMMVNAAVYYVKTTAAGDKSGSSWANASDDLQAMINKAQPDDLIFVAAGEYAPNKASNHLSGEINPHNRDNAFVLKKDVKIYGSFPADANDSEHNTIECRFPDAWILRTYLLGNLTGNKDWDEFAYHVLISAGDVGSALIDGIIVANGNANGSGSIVVNGYEILRDMGGGMHNMSSSPNLYGVIIMSNIAKYAGGGMFNYSSSPTITEVGIKNNVADNVGGGMYNAQSSPVLSYVSISENYAEKNGGGMNNTLFSSPVMSNTTFEENQAEYGGGMYNYMGVTPTVKYSEFISNIANFGGGVYNYKPGNILFQNIVVRKNRTTEGAGAGIANIECNPVFMNALIVENTSKIVGAGMSNNLSSPVLVNTTISRNYASTSGTYGGALYNSVSSYPKLYNSVVWGNVGYPQVHNVTNSTISCSNSLVETVTSNSGTNIAGSTDPLFVGGTDDDYDYCLQLSSPCVDKGSNEYYTSFGGNINTDIDLLENPRFTGTSIDMGAYEAMAGSGISTSEVRASTDVIGLDGRIQFTGMQNTEVFIYSLDGVLLYTYRISGNLETIPVPKGIYLVSSSNKISRKVLVK